MHQFSIALRQTGGQQVAFAEGAPEPWKLSRASIGAFDIYMRGCGGGHAR